MSEPTIVTISKTIQDRLLAILEEAGEELCVDDREVTLVREIPEDRHSQVGLPVVAVNRPSLEGDELTSLAKRRQRYAVLIELVDARGVSTVREREADERLYLLREHVRGALRAEPHLTMPEYCVFASLTSWDLEPEPTDFGNNLRRIRMIVTIPLTVGAADAES